MLKALLSHDDKTAFFNMPHNSLEVENYLLAVGALKPYAGLYLNDDEDDPEQVQVKLIADTAIDNHLQLLFAEEAKLSTVNTVCDLFYRLPIERQIGLTHNMADGKINNEKDLLDAIKATMAPAEPIRVNFYCPLTVLKDDPESGEVINADNALLAGQEHHLLSELGHTLLTYGITDMADFFTEDDCRYGISATEKLISAKWGAENIAGVIYGRIAVDLTEPLTENEQDDIASWIFRQNQTGIGNDLARYPIETLNGRLYINYYQNDDQYFLLDEAEYKNRFGRELKPPQDISAIVFSRVKLWTDTGEECEFFMGGVPEANDAFEDNEDFEDFVNQISTTDTKEITAYITIFSEGDGECVPATQADIERVYNAIADVDIDTITGWNKIGESQFSFDYDIDELFNLKGNGRGTSDKERQKKEFSALVEKLMDEVNCGSNHPIMIWRENNGWASAFTAHFDGGNGVRAIREKDPSAIMVTGADFAKGSYAYVYDKILALRFRAEYDATPPDAVNRAELAEIVDFLEDSMGSLSSNAADHLASLDNPVAEIHAHIASNISDKEFDEVIDLIENMRGADEQPGMSGIE
ncbi:MAG: hypothetical protein FWF05_04375 [Oscillospiraceae bacterium]|nr:hypothetical protein [Oscillospiraceae bacterium]